MKKIIGLFLIGMVMVACNDTGVNSSGALGFTTIKLENGKFTDKRDGNKYAVVEIGRNLWMAENLRYADSSKTKNLKGNVWCYENKADSCSKYGALYSWTAAMDYESKYNSTMKYSSVYHQKGICPDGWHIPSWSEWNELHTALQNQSVNDVVGADMKSVKGWQQEELATKAMNRFGFNVLPAGRRNSENGEFMSTGKYAFFWADDEIDEATSVGFTLRYDRDNFEKGTYYKDHGMSVRCVIANSDVKVEGDIDSSYLDEIPFDYGELEIGGAKYKTIKIGSQNWMAENVNFKTDDSWCYNDDSERCEKYGRLYSFEQAKTICPEGWHLPTSTDVNVLVNSVMHYASSLRSREGWTDKGGKGWNLWGFNALPAGGRESGDYFDSAVSAYMWVDGLQVMWVPYYSEEVKLQSKGTGSAFPVRCVED